MATSVSATSVTKVKVVKVLQADADWAAAPFYFQGDMAAEITTTALGTAAHKAELEAFTEMEGDGHGSSIGGPDTPPMSECGSPTHHAVAAAMAIPSAANDAAAAAATARLHGAGLKVQPYPLRLDEYRQLEEENERLRVEVQQLRSEQRILQSTCSEQVAAAQLAQQQAQEQHALTVGVLEQQLQQAWGHVCELQMTSKAAELREAMMVEQLIQEDQAQREAQSRSMAVLEAQVIALKGELEVAASLSEAKLESSRRELQQAAEEKRELCQKLSSCVEEMLKQQEQQAHTALALQQMQARLQAQAEGEAALGEFELPVGELRVELRVLKEQRDSAMAEARDVKVEREDLREELEGAEAKLESTSRDLHETCRLLCACVQELEVHQRLQLEHKEQQASAALDLKQLRAQLAVSWQEVWALQAQLAQQAQQAQRTRHTGVMKGTEAAASCSSSRACKPRWR